ncbi:copper chaperone PCu(A)C [Gilvimarinus polysaccharolyticus]|uniref:copper chaperone PCu(A)C n=1 Tax=Gilvimarinus polysaccharolyticus TaxID=863921 RepID=UPI0006733481|nr:copper chaperone PCu(A)C [Gilvimarinus polysaccharolyticus]
MLRIMSFFVILCGFLAIPAHAGAAPEKASATVVTVSVTDAVLQLPIPGTHNSAVFLRLTNTGAAPLTLVGVSTSAAAKAQLHSHTKVDGMMRMRPLESLSIAPGQTLVFESGGNHIMLLDVQRTLTSGDIVALTFEFADGATQEVQVAVTSRYDDVDHSHHH